MGRFDETADLDSVRMKVPEAWLVISAADGVRAIPLPKVPRIVVGRMPDCNIVIQDDSVSRQHAAIYNTKDGLSIEDLGSRNKTKVMGRSLSRGETAPLSVGSVVEIGYVTMFVQVGRPHAGPSRAVGAGHQTSPATPVIADPTMQRLYALLDVIAPSPLNVLVLGETGTGKEIFAEAIHTGSSRAGAPFLRINCAALSGSLLESELFGHEKGAFTGALGAKMGLFEAADGGTLFLDEVGELPIDTQAKLLRAIEYGEITRLGSVTPRRVDVRYVAATNRDIQQLIGEQRFRSDLFFRLNGFSVTLPPLRKRPKEIIPLARLFLQRAAQGRPFVIAPEAEQTLLSYGWPGNVRELKSVVERALVLSGPASHIEPAHLHLPSASESAPPPIPSRSPSEAPPFATSEAPAIGMDTASGDLRSQRESWERSQILSALEKTSGNQKEAAVLLGISRRTLINKIEAYGIARPRKR